MAYRTPEQVKEKPQPIVCNNPLKLKARIAQLKRDKARKPNKQGIVRKWTNRKEYLLNSYKERLKTA